MGDRYILSFLTFLLLGTAFLNIYSVICYYGKNDLETFFYPIFAGALIWIAILIIKNVLI